MAIAGYISAVYQHIKQLEYDANPLPAAHASQSQSAILGVGARVTIAEFAHKLIAEEMAQKLFELVNRID